MCLRREVVALVAAVLLVRGHRANAATWGFSSFDEPRIQGGLARRTVAAECATGCPMNESTHPGYSPTEYVACSNGVAELGFVSQAVCDTSCELMAGIAAGPEGEQAFVANGTGGSVRITFDSVDLDQAGGHVRASCLVRRVSSGQSAQPGAREESGNWTREFNSTALLSCSSLTACPSSTATDSCLLLRTGSSCSERRRLESCHRVQQFRRAGHLTASGRAHRCDARDI